MSDSYFVLNGIANNYYKNRVITYSESNAILNSKSATATVSANNNWGTLINQRFGGSQSATISSDKGTSIAFNEEREIVVPAKTSKIITEYIITEALYRDCDLLRFPETKADQVKRFSKAESPLVFANRLVYQLADAKENISMEHEFFVSQVTNADERNVLDQKNEEFCGEKGMNISYTFKDSTPDKFYLKYTKDDHQFKH